MAMLCAFIGASPFFNYLLPHDLCERLVRSISITTTYSAYVIDLTDLPLPTFHDLIQVAVEADPIGVQLGYTVRVVAHVRYHEIFLSNPVLKDFYAPEIKGLEFAEQRREFYFKPSSSPDFTAVFNVLREFKNM